MKRPTTNQETHLTVALGTGEYSLSYCHRQQDQWGMGDRTGIADVDACRAHDAWASVLLE